MVGGSPQIELVQKVFDASFDSIGRIDDFYIRVSLICLPTKG